MTTLAWPATSHFNAAQFTFGAMGARSAFAGFFSGETQSVAHLADRLRASVVLRACSPLEAGQREAFFTQLATRGDLLALHHLQRPQPIGTLRGSPTLAAGASQGAISIQVQGIVGATLVGGDMLGLHTGQLVQVGYAGAVANGAGVLTVPLVLPLRAAATGGTAVVWSQPTATFQVASNMAEFGYGRGAWQAAIELTFAEVY